MFPANYDAESDRYIVHDGESVERYFPGLEANPDAAFNISTFTAIITGLLKEGFEGSWAGQNLDIIV